jgi:hypothetical protein
LSRHSPLIQNLQAHSPRLVALAVPINCLVARRGCVDGFKVCWCQRDGHALALGLHDWGRSGVHWLLLQPGIGLLKQSLAQTKQHVKLFLNFIPVFF